MSKTTIEWTETTWNPTTGCTKVSSGCKNCYAEKMSKRLKAMGVKKYVNGFDLICHPNTLSDPYKWRKPRKVFVNSMSDLFHKDVPLDYIKQVFKVMNDNPKHVFQVLTKRSERLAEVADMLCWTDNIWMGVSVEDSLQKHRIDDLRQVNAKIRFLSCEPLIGDLGKMDLTGIHWVIVGGESGSNSRPIDKEWVESIHQQCIENIVPFFFKQWGGWNKKKNGRLLNGETYSEMPVRSDNKENYKRA
jgi:protein gp37